MRTRTSLLLVPVFVFTALLGASLSKADDAQPSVMLQYKYQPEQTIYYSVVNGSHIMVQYDVNQHEVTHSSASVKHFRVVDVFENGTAVLRLMIDRAYMRADQLGEAVVFDSASSESPPEQFVGVAATVGRPWVDVTVSPRGEVLNVEPLIAGVADINITTEVQNNVLALLPEEAVQVGDSWTEEFTVGVQIDTTSRLQREIRMQRIYTLKSIENGQATIDLRTVPLSPIRDHFQEGQLLQRSPTGTLVIDIESGTLVSRNLQVEGEAVGFSGPTSCMTVDSDRIERLIDAGQMDAFFNEHIAAQNAAQAAAPAPAAQQ